MPAENYREPEKKQGGKKDKFSKAAQEQLGTGGIMGTFAGDLKETGKIEAPTNKDEISAPLPNADFNLPYHAHEQATESGASSHSNEPSGDEPPKKDLSGGGHAVRLTAVEQGRLKKIDPQQLMASDFRYDEPPVWKKPLIIGIASLLAVALLFFAFFGSRSQPRIFLSNSEIKDGIIKSLPTANLVFPKGKEIFIHFNAGTRFGTDKITIRVTEIYQDPSGAVKEDNIGVTEQTVKPGWRKLYTLFQQDYFDHAGQYKVYIQAGGGAVLATQDFKIK